MLGSSWESVLSVQIWITKSGPAAPLATSRPSRFILSTTRPTRAWHLVLIVGLGLSLAPWIVAAEAHTSKSGSHGEVCVQSKHLKNSPEAARGDQAEAPTDLIVVQAPEVRPGPLSKRFPQGSHLVRLAPFDPTPHSLTPDFFTAADPRISLDGTHVLFAAQRTADSSWQIWEINVDGSDVRQITRCPGDCLKAAYLPRGQIVYTSLAEGPAGGTSGEPVATHIPLLAGSASTVSQIWVSKVDGSDAHPITFGPGDFEVETVLKNGMILATARSPLLPSSRLPADRELYTLRLDGTGLATLRCDHQHPAIRRQAQELDDGAVIFVKSSLGSRSLGGDLAWIPRGALHDSPLTSLVVGFGTVRRRAHDAWCRRRSEVVPRLRGRPLSRRNSSSAPAQVPPS